MLLLVIWIRSETFVTARLHKSLSVMNIQLNCMLFFVSLLYLPIVRFFASFPLVFLCVRSEYMVEEKKKHHK